ncbi:MAG: multifunctional CCA tRNA nucleotidyl transferase/2'3'-cyclic phosphodiesterase/2'nucleotidase/phosphatase, partial [Steroidobacteraceae bacterium]
LRRPERFTEFLVACQADAQGRAGLQDKPYPQREYLQQARSRVAAVTLTSEERAGLAGPAIGDKLRRKRLALLETQRPATR